MSKDRATTGTDGRPLPVLPPERDARVWARACRIMFYTPGFLALLLLKVGEPTGFGISVELLMLASMSAVVAAIFIGAGSDGAGADHASRTGVWSGCLVLELLAVVPLLTAVPSLFHELASSKLLHDPAAPAAQVALGFSELIPAAAILPFMLYQLAGFGTLRFVLPKAWNIVANLGILVLIVASYVANRQGNFAVEKALVGVLILAMTGLVFYGVLALRRNQQRYDAFRPDKVKDKQGAA
ncbi:MAG: hypothetical protein J0L57_05210 [Burkholderiales bacterium]|nr:hypothetical protein [Burkholderiales bacterium]